MQDTLNAISLGINSATYTKEGRLHYASLISSYEIQGDCEVVGDLESNHIALYIKKHLGKRQVTYRKKRIILKNEDTEAFIQNMDNWYRDYRADNVDNFIDDLLRETEKNLISSQPKVTNKVHRAKKNYAYDKILRGWTQMLKVAHKEDR